MRRALRAAVLVLAALALQLTLAGAAEACPAAMHAGAATGMPEMSGASAPEVTRSSASAAYRGAAHEMGTPAGTPCPDAGMPPSCRIATSCASTASTVADRPTDGRTVRPERVIAHTALEPASLSLPPELPPPRA